jgi:hypothetical protein
LFLEFLPQESSGQANKASMLRKREVALARISIYIVFVFLFCHSVRIVPNTYEMISTYTEVTTRTLPLHIGASFFAVKGEF